MQQNIVIIILLLFIFLIRTGNFFFKIFNRIFRFLIQTDHL